MAVKKTKQKQFDLLKIFVNTYIPLVLIGS